MRRLAALLVASLGSGCSFLFSQGPPDDHERLAYFDCTSSGAAPATDLYFAAASGLGVLVSDEADGSDRSSALILGTSAALTTASAIYGFITNGTCAAAKAKLEQRSIRAQLELGRAREAAKARPGCRRDIDCRSDRICTNETCVDRAKPTPPAPDAHPPASNPQDTNPQNTPVPSQNDI